MGWISCLRNTRCFSCPFPLSILCTGQVHNWNEAENSMEFPEALPDLSCGVVKNSKRRRRAWRYWRKCWWVRSHGCGNRKFFDWFFLRATKLLLDFFVGFFLWILDRVRNSVLKPRKCNRRSICTNIRLTLNVASIIWSFLICFFEAK